MNDWEGEEMEEKTQIVFFFKITNGLMKGVFGFYF